MQCAQQQNLHNDGYLMVVLLLLLPFICESAFIKIVYHLTIGHFEASVYDHLMHVCSSIREKESRSIVCMKFNCTSSNRKKKKQQVLCMLIRCD